MASRTLDVASLYADGTTLNAYSFGPYVDNPDGTPPPTATATAVSSGGTVTFTGLADGTLYYAGTGTGGYQYFGFSTPAASVSGGSGVPADGSITPAKLSFDPATQAELDAVSAAALFKSIVDAKGDLIVGTADDTLARFGVGTDGYQLLADSTTGSGLKWSPPSAAGLSTRRYDIRSYGAVCDGVELSDVAIASTSGNAVVSSASRAFVNGDVGKTIGVAGAGVTADGGVLKSTIVSVAGGNATLGLAATNTVSGAYCAFGTPDDAAIAAAQTAAKTGAFVGSTVGGTVVFPDAKTIVTAALPLENYVSWAGANKETSIVIVIKDGGYWMQAASSLPSAPLTGCTFSNFKIEGALHFRTGGTSTNTKSFGIQNIKRVVVREMWIANAPATAIPCDYSQDQCIIANNLITNPGRMGPGAGGHSGIGMGTNLANVQGTEPTLVTGNVVLGVGSSAGNGPANNGIFIEAQTGTATNAAIGYRIIGNYVRGTRFGIVDAGGRGTVIANNVVEGCTLHNYGLTGGTITPGFPGVDTIVTGNVSINAVTTAGGHGMNIDLSLATSHTNISTCRVIVSNNQFVGNNGCGLQILMNTVNPDGLVIANNVFRANGLSGMKVIYAASGTTAVLKNTKITGNVFVNNGQRASGTDKNGIRFETPLTDCNVQGNYFYDDQGSKTQQYAVQFLVGATVTGGAFRQNDMRNNGTGAINNLGNTISATTVIDGNLGWNGGGPVAVTATASPMTYTAGAYPEDVYVDGGTVSSITKGGVQVRSTTGATVRLGSGEAMTITYSAAPTIVADKR